MPFEREREREREKEGIRGREVNQAHVRFATLLLGGKGMGYKKKESREYDECHSDGAH